MICGAILTASPATGASPTVDTTRCFGLDAREVARLLDLEISTMHQGGDPAPSFDLELTCAGGTMRMALVDPTTSKRLERSIPMPSPGPGAERVVALAASQLLVASWLELVASPPDPEVPASLPPPRPSPVARRVARQRIAVPKAQTDARLGLDAGTTVRQLRRPSVLFGLGGSAALWMLPRLSASLEAGFEHGTASRETGSVSMWLSWIGVGAGWRESLSPHVDWEFFALAGPAFVQLNGRPNSTAFVGKSATSVSGQVWLRTGPRMQAGPLRLGLAIGGGWLARAPDGTVAGDEPVELGGGYVSSMVSVAWGM